jgi:ubiquinone/menaquinone biosynthesis C-methylase UbiE
MENPMKYNIATRARECSIKKYLKLIKNKDQVLDLGCGLGYFTRLLSKQSKNVKGIDIEEDCINFAKNQYKDAKFLVGNALNTTFPDEEFDFIFSSEVIEHLPDDKKYMKEVNRILKKEGYFLLTTISTEGIFKVTDLCHESGSEKHFKNGYTEKEIQRLANLSNFKIIKTEYCMTFFTKIIIELMKKVYKNKFKSFEKQSDVLNKTNSLLYKLLKMMFPLFYIFIGIDYYLSRLIKGNNIIVLMKKK